MLSRALFVRLEAKPGKEDEVASFLETGLKLANDEKTTLLWCSLRLGQSTFGVFDAFADDAGRKVHLEGPIAQALMARAPELFAREPIIERIELLGTKLPR
jgi:quinol monooxygenase YgiN